MPFVLNDRVLETCTSPGTGSVALQGTVPGYQTFLSGIGDGNTFYYTLIDQVGTNWETGQGTYISDDNSITRNTVYASSNNNNPVNFTTGTQKIFVDLPGGQAVVNNGGTYGITVATANALNTGNSYQVASLGVGAAASGTVGEIRATNNITAYYSDERLKTKVSDIENPLDKVRQIETMMYHANEKAVALGYDDSIIEVGVTAGSVKNVMPQVVALAPIDNNYLTVRYERLVPLLIEAIKELEQKVLKLENK